MVQNKFRQLLSELGLSPEQFAEALDISTSAVYKLLNGRTKKISNSLALKISKKFVKYSYEYILSLNKIDDFELIIQDNSQIEVQKIVDIVIDNLDKFKKNNEFIDLVLKPCLLDLLEESKTKKN